MTRAAGGVNCSLFTQIHPKSNMFKRFRRAFGFENSRFAFFELLYLSPSPRFWLYILEDWTDHLDSRCIHRFRYAIKDWGLKMWMAPKLRVPMFCVKAPERLKQHDWVIKLYILVTTWDGHPSDWPNQNQQTLWWLINRENVQQHYLVYLFHSGGCRESRFFLQFPTCSDFDLESLVTIIFAICAKGLQKAWVCYLGEA